MTSLNRMAVDGSNPESRRDLSIAYAKMARACLVSDSPAEAVVYYRQALAGEEAQQEAARAATQQASASAPADGNTPTR